MYGECFKLSCSHWKKTTRRITGLPGFDQAVTYTLFYDFPLVSYCSLGECNTGEAWEHKKWLVKLKWIDRASAPRCVWVYTSNISISNTGQDYTKNISVASRKDTTNCCCFERLSLSLDRYTYGDNRFIKAL